MSPTPSDTSAKILEGRWDKDLPGNIDQTVHDFIGAQNLNRGAWYIETCPQKYRFLLVEKLILFAIESTAADAQLVCDLFSLPNMDELCPPDCLEMAFTLVAEGIDDLALDSPEAFKRIVIMIKRVHLDRDVERLARIVMKSRQRERFVTLF